jgi:TIR domain-containing protein
MPTIFFSYSHKDEDLRDQLETHLAMLKRQGVISAWHDRRLIAGTNIDTGIRQELDRAHIILLLVSPDFLASDYCYGVEMTRALERHAAGDARVIPVILRPCDWTHTPFGKLLAAPRDGKPVTKWTDPDDAFLDIARAIRAAAAASTNGSSPETASIAQATTGSGTPAAAGPRSSNLRVRKSFTEQDRDRFLDEAFEYMGRFFENSLQELESRNPGIGGRFKRVDGSRYTAAVYRDGAALARCQIRLGGGVGNGISFSFSGNLGDNSFNENLSVEVDEQALYLRPLGMQRYHDVSQESHLSFEGAAEYYWALFIQPLQGKS